MVTKHDSKSYKTDVDKCAEIVKTLVKKNSTSKLETEYQVVMNYGYSPSTYAVALEEVGPNWVYVAKDVATRYKSEEMTDLRKVMMTLLERFGGFSEGEAIYGSSVITTSK